MIRRLKPGETVPTHTPRRYVNKAGYVILRWQVGTRSHVDCFEHRVFDGKTTTAEHVHHINHVRDDNRPENLRPMTAAEHRLEHDPSEVHAEVVKLYKSGLTTIQVGELVDMSSSWVSRIIAENGVDARKPRDYEPPIDLDLIRLWHSQGVRASEMMRRTRRGRQSIYEAFDQLGLPRFGSGNPGNGRQANA